MGTVWLALDTALDRMVALKAPRTCEATSRDLEREARVAARLDHPGIVAVHDVTELDGLPAYVMSHIRGVTLSSLLQEGSIGAWPLVDRVRLIRQAAEAVGHAHARGVVHGDLSPANLLYTEEGRVVVIDWGLATVADEPSPRRRGGTPGFSAPELHHATPIPASDVWSLGAILTALLRTPALDEGSRLPEAAPPCSRLIAEMSPPGSISPADEENPDGRTLPATVPVTLRVLVERSLARGPDNRWTDAGTFATALFDWERAMRQAPGARQSSSAQWIAPGLLAIGLLGILVLGLFGHRSDPATGLSAASSSENVLAPAIERAIRDGDPERARALASTASQSTNDPWLLGLMVELSVHPPMEAHAEALPERCSTPVATTGASILACVEGDVLTFLQKDHLLTRREAPLRGLWLDAHLAYRVDALRHLSIEEVDSGVVFFTSNRPGSFAHPGTPLRISADQQAVLRPPSAANLSGDPSTPPQEITLTPPCREGILSADARSMITLVGCNEGGAWWTEGTTWHALASDGDPLELVALINDEMPPRAFGASRAGVVHELGGARRTFASQETSKQLLPLQDGAALALLGGRGMLHILDAESLAPRWSQRVRPGTLSETGTGTLSLLTETGLFHWELPPSWPQRRIQSPHGHAALAWTEDSRWLIAGSSGGEVLAFAPRDGAIQGRHRWGTGVTMSLARNPANGEVWLIGPHSGGPRPITVDPLTAGPPFPIDGSFRQIHAIGPDHFALASYRFGWASLNLGRGELRWPLDMVDSTNDPATGTDIRHISSTPDLSRHLWVADSGAWLTRTDAPAHRIHPDEGWERGALSTTGSILLQRDNTLSLLQADGTPIARQDAAGPVTAVVAHPVEPWFITGTLEGSVQVWSADDAREIARWTPHTARVAALSVSPDGRQLGTGSWDGQVFAFDLSVLLESSGRAARSL